MKTLVVYYTYGGETKKAAEYIASNIGSDLLPLSPIEDDKPIKPIPWPGPQITLVKKTKLEDITGVNWDEYQLVFIGSPVWANTVSPPVHSFIKDIPFENKDIALFSMNDGKENKCLKVMEKVVSRKNNVVAKNDILNSSIIAEMEVQKNIMKWTDSILKDNIFTNEGV